MPSLNWIGKEKIVNHDKDVPFRLMRKNKKYSLGNSENLILEGDNLEALKALMPFYYGKIKCIYIDPPYNTGNEKWIYNDRVNSPKIKKWLGKVVGPEGDDLTRHDKWLCMMYPRLKLLRELLSEDGVIFVSIDDNEIHYLTELMGEIFGKENVDICVWKKIDPKYDKNVNAKIITRTKRVHEFIVIGYKKKKDTIFEKIKKLPRWNTKKSNPDNDPRGGYESGILSFEEKHKNENKKSEYYYTIITPSGRKITRQFFVTKEEFEDLLADNRIYFPKKGDGIPRLKIFENEEKDFYFETILEGVGSLNSAKKEQAEIFNIIEEDVFDTPKPTKLVKEIIRAITQKNSLILDSFAGSGTTAHAVLDLNKEDGGSRKFILVELEKNIAKNITAERVKRVAQGYSYKTNKGKDVKVLGLGGGFEYVELGEPLFDKHGMINKAVSFQDMARYVYFTETRMNLEKKSIKGNYLGEFGNNHYFLLFDGIGKNVLNRKFLRELKPYVSKKKIVYADKCLIDEEILEKYQIIFKQIPYQVKIY